MKLLYYTVFFICFSLAVNAQRLPETQSNGMWAPSQLKIDGANREWGAFSAENKRTGLHYTIANDDKNLYLAIMATTNEAVTKIMAGGITFTVNTKGKKKEEDGFSVTYPLVGRTSANRGGGQRMGRQRLSQNKEEQSEKHRDSALTAQRKAQLATVKEIKIAGFKGIADSLISIYNEYGIKAIAKLDEAGAYVYEMAIPLSLLDLTVSDTKELAYQIKLNGRSGGNYAMRTMAGGNARGGNANMASQDLMVPTDFWGKYILQKK
jgi:cobalamin biosynthesis Mg chelatase CobN